MKFYDNFDKFMLNESVKQAKKFLNEKGIDYTQEGTEEKEVFDNIVRDLSKMNNLIGNFVKYHFEEGVPYIDEENLDESDFSDIKGTIEYIIQNKGKIKNMLKKNIIDYESFEHLTDDIEEAEIKQKIKTEFVNTVLINKVNIYEDPYDRKSPIIETIEGNYRKNFDFNNVKMVSVAELFIEEFNKFIKSSKFNKFIKDNKKNPKRDRIPAFMSVYDILPIHVAMKEKWSLLKYISEIESKIVNNRNLESNPDGLDKNQKIETFKKEIRETYDYESTNLVYEKDNVLVYRTFRKTFIVNHGSGRWCIVTRPERFYNQYCSPISGKTQYLIYNFNYENHEKNSLWGVTINNIDGSTPSDGCQDRFNKSYKLSDVESINGIPSGVLIPYEYDPAIVTKFQTFDDIVRRLKNINNEQEILSIIKDDMDLIEVFGTDVSILQDCYDKKFWDIFKLIIDTGGNPNIKVNYNIRYEEYDDYLFHELLFNVKNTFRGNENNRIKLLKSIFNSNRLDVDVRDRRMGRTALHHAVKAEDITSIEVLLKKGADVNAASGKDVPPTGNTPLSLTRNTEITKILLDAGADPLIDRGKGSSMDLAKMYKRQNLIDLYNKYI